MKIQKSSNPRYGFMGTFDDSNSNPVRGAWDHVSRLLHSAFSDIFVSTDPSEVSHLVRMYLDSKGGRKLADNLKNFLSREGQSATDYHSLSSADINNVLVKMQNPQSLIKDLTHMLNNPHLYENVKLTRTPKELVDEALSRPGTGLVVGANVKVLRGRHQGSIGTVVDVDYDPDDTNDPWQYTVKVNGKTSYLSTADVELQESAESLMEGHLFKDPYITEPRDFITWARSNRINDIVGPNRIDVPGDSGAPPEVEYTVAVRHSNHKSGQFGMLIRYNLDYQVSEAGPEYLAIVNAISRDLARRESLRIAVIDRDFQKGNIKVVGKFTVQ